MLKSMRESFHHLKWILLAVVAAFIIGFVYVDMGLGGASQRQQSDKSYAARVNGETISYPEYSRTLYNLQQSYRQMYGGRLTPELEEAMGLSRQALESAIDQRLLLQEASRLHLDATTAEVRRHILQIPELNEGGKWAGDELYQRWVQFNGYATAADYEDALARQLTLMKIESAIANSIVISPKAAETEYRRNTENAKIRYVLYSGRTEAASIALTPAEIKAFYDANQSKYTHAEQRELKYLVADVTRIRMSITPSEQQIKARYEATKEDYKQPDTAHVLHILIKLEPTATPEQVAAAKAKADSIVQQLRAGADFGKLAKENSGDPSSAGNGGDMGYIERGKYLAPFEDAVFSLPLNQVSDPIRTQEYGFHIVKVLDRRPAGYKPFEEVRLQVGSQVANELAQQQAKDEINKITLRIKEKRPSTPAEFSALSNDRVSSNDTQWFQKGESIPGLGYNQPLATWAFAAKQGDITPDPIGTQRGPALVYVAGIRPAGVTPFDDIKQKVEADAKTARGRDLAKQKLADAMKGAANVDAVAASLKLTPQETTVTRQSGFISGIPGDTSGLVDAAMAAPTGTVQGPVVAGDGAVVFQVVEQKKATPAEIAQNRAAFMESLRQREAQNLRASLLQRLRKSAKIDVNEKMIEQQKNAPQQGA